MEQLRQVREALAMDDREEETEEDVNSRDQNGPKDLQLETFFR